MHVHHLLNRISYTFAVRDNRASEPVDKSITTKACTPVRKRILEKEIFCIIAGAGCQVNKTLVPISCKVSSVNRSLGDHQPCMERAESGTRERSISKVKPLSLGHQVKLKSEEVEASHTQPRATPFWKPEIYQAQVIILVGPVAKQTLGERKTEYALNRVLRVSEGEWFVAKEVVACATNLQQDVQHGMMRAEHITLVVDPDDHFSMSEILLLHQMPNQTPKDLPCMR
ncbi:predicted protein [Histoplasma capsulatum G186AR]|uniref:Uncharacterized protein n=1 Tax=Ajellomyces capsulatus (strain G186AR / H82 / ATCC MYA-2454 / RMSCC 2432) TaxID=447093 RepID=C0NXR6_AJECG|nr:uncharacterized protein HCBG_07710 [Histoplasma capsulatum G186AR]EEH03584.1 predicted protein [Histoplasma capsulatum G186AR]